MIILYLIMFFVLFIVPIGIGYLIYFLIKKHWNIKFAKYFAIIYSSIFIFISCLIFFEDDLFSKNDAKKLVEEQEIILKDNFSLLNNKTETAIGDYNHSFELEISENDRANAINEIKSSKNFELFENKVIDYLYSAEINRYEGEKQIQNYETEYGFVREYFQPNGKGYAPTFRRIIIYKSQNKLKFEDIDE